MLEGPVKKRQDRDSPGWEVSRPGADLAALAGGSRPGASPVWDQLLNEDRAD